MRTRRHPLHDAIDAGRWDAEPPLGRLVVVAHAALLDAGFVPCGSGRPAFRRPLPEQVGAVASSLSLRYTIPEFLLHRRRHAETAVLRLSVHGDLVVLYGYLTGDGNRATRHWACIDAALVAPVLSGGLEATAHALANDAAMGGAAGRRYRQGSSVISAGNVSPEAVKMGAGGGIQRSA
ncbi:hypothetical protein E2562_008799 [Oryza meyeriana var. granulata]|uniref:Uncharacterized protein n=1 Tax=Oryza meyeriana var. granulata TaxID=110450 RepID=A0A6G1D003_9ORYZ|nr:hypothetical protein E2562_008799 [Oryza meyeriana var. granulata]